MLDTAAARSSDASNVSARSSQTAQRLPAPRVSRLFVRIYLTVAVTVLAFAVLAGIGVWFLTRPPSQQWRTDLSEASLAVEPQLRQAVQQRDEALIRHTLAELQSQFDIDVALALPRGLLRRGGPREGGAEAEAWNPRRRPGSGPPPSSRMRIISADSRAGHGPAARDGLRPGPGPRDHQAVHAATRAALAALGRDDLRRLRRGRSVVQQSPWAVTRLYWPVLAPSESSMAGPAKAPTPAFLVFAERRHPRTRLILGLVAFLAVLALGVLPLVRHFTARLSALESAARALASGDLSTRAPLQTRGSRDEIDQLAHAFNSMAESIERLVGGQRALLANVSHELRTPVARMRVLVEILDERLEKIGGNTDDAAKARVVLGLEELATDMAELERLISDLLTGGRLALGPDALEGAHAIEINRCGAKACERHGVSMQTPDGPLFVRGDELLLERLLTNILSNARRACPDGMILCTCSSAGSEISVAIEDEGPGVPEADRESIFEPFTRLDDARTRDQGGVGLGLYLCRQIARAHGGEVTAQGRLDGRRGARFEIRLPRCAG